MAVIVVSALLASLAVRGVHRVAKAELDVRSGALAVATGTASEMVAAAEAAAEKARALAPEKAAE